jgi:hypothetical protein
MAAQTKQALITEAINGVRNFRFCGPSDDPDEQTAVTLGFRHLVIQLKRLAGPLLHGTAASRLNAINVEVNDLYSAFDAKAELDALLPDIEIATELLGGVAEARTMSTLKTLPIDCFYKVDAQVQAIYIHEDGVSPTKVRKVPQKCVLDSCVQDRLLVSLIDRLQ